ncbi:hypothetical protein Tco_0924041 [Tanacetum coccineum]|uniref:Uncharacterized protein n=1 Tax=Tanacetum coccineum TaxID=301880 RepID=A0ABQ5D461_9ASTR
MKGDRDGSDVGLRTIIPAWLEITEYMESFPELTIADRLDIVDQVFKRTVQDYVKFVRNERQFGDVTEDMLLTYPLMSELYAYFVHPSEDDKLYSDPIASLRLLVIFAKTLEVNLPSRSERMSRHSMPEKIKDVKVEYVSLTCDTPLEVFNKEVSRLSGMDNDLFTYEVEVTNILCNSKIDDDSEYEADDDMRGDDKVELTDEESSDDEDEIAETYDDYKDDWIYEWNKDVPWVYDKPWIDNGIWKEPTPVKHTCKPFNYKTECSEWPTCSWRDDGYCNGGNLPETYIIGNQLHYQDYEWYEALEDCELKMRL